MLVTPGRLRNAKFTAQPRNHSGLREWYASGERLAAFAARQFFLNACNFPPFAYLKSDNMTRHTLPLFNPWKKTTTRVVGSILVSAPDLNRLQSVYETDALPNELACDFRPIAWCKSESPGGELHPGVESIWRDQQLRLHDLLDHRAFLAERLCLQHRLQRALHLIHIRELFHVHFRVR
jgi:hypothetical protein